MKTTVIVSCLLIGSALTLPTHNLVSNSSKATTVKGTVSKRSPFKTMPVAPVRIIVDKTNYELYVYDKMGWFATYPVVFGSNNLDDKKMEGDKKTPEGNFKIASKRVHEKWERYLGLDYPTKESLEKFRQRKQRGEVPANASPGGGVGIHGTWPHEDYVIDRYKNWTNGCVSLKNEDIKDLYSYVPVGTPVTIRK